MRKFAHTGDGQRVLMEFEAVYVPKLRDSKGGFKRLLSHRALTQLQFGLSQQPGSTIHLMTPAKHMIPLHDSGGLWGIDLHPVPGAAINHVAHPATRSMLDILHLRLGHRHKESILRQNDTGGATGSKLHNLSLSDYKRNHKPGHEEVCDGCARGAHFKSSVPAVKPERATRPLQLVHMDIIGKISKKSLVYQNQYVLNLTDDYTRLSRVYFMRHKNESLHYFKKFRSEVESANCKIEVLQSDNDTVFTSGEFESYCLDNLIYQRFSLPDRQWQNGVAERSNRTLIEMANKMLATAQLPSSYWECAMRTACYLYNRCGNSSLPGGISPYQAWTGKPPDWSHLRVFGSPCYTYIEKRDRDGKFADRSKRCVFVGYSPDNKHGSYLVYSPSQHKFLVTRDMWVDEGAILNVSPGHKRDVAGEFVEACDESEYVSLEDLMPLVVDDADLSNSSSGGIVANEVVDELQDSNVDEQLHRGKKIKNTPPLLNVFFVTIHGV